jgi:hypothetical protein
MAATDLELFVRGSNIKLCRGRESTEGSENDFNLNSVFCSSLLLLKLCFVDGCLLLCFRFSSNKKSLFASSSPLLLQRRRHELKRKLFPYNSGSRPFLLPLLALLHCCQDCCLFRKRSSTFIYFKNQTRKVFAIDKTNHNDEMLQTRSIVWFLRPKSSRGFEVWF